MPDEQRNAAPNAIDEACQPIMGSRKVYVSGSRSDIRVPMREIRQDPTPLANGELEQNPPLSVYDTSGPYTDPDARIDIRQGLPPLRDAWIEERGDSEQLAGLTSDYGRRRAADVATAGLRFPHIRAPGYCHPGDGIHRHPRKPAPARASRSRLAGGAASGPQFRRRHS